MKFSFSGRHMEIGESLLNRAKEACESLANKYNTQLLDVNIVMKKDNYLFYSDISIKTSNGNYYLASNEANDPVVSFDGLTQKIDAQMRKKKNCRCSCKRKTPEINNLDNSLLNEEDSDKDSRLIVAEVLDDLPLSSVSDAADRLNDKCRVFVFENISNNAVNVVYTRDDGNVGWIDYKIKR